MIRLELVVLIVAAFFAYNAYHDGKYTAMIRTNKKYLQVAGYIAAGVSLYLVLRKDPVRGKEMLLQASNTMKYLPIDKQTTSVLSPVIDFTMGSGRNFMSALNPPRTSDNIANMEQKILQSGSVRSVGAPHTHRQKQFGGHQKTKGTKRSVSETKKKYVASMQDWHCGDCRDKLNAWFEVDHKVRLEYGGGNDVENLVALCRNCHGKKTAFENM